MSVEIITNTVTKMVETSVEEKSIVITLNVDDAVALTSLIGGTGGNTLQEVYDKLSDTIEGELGLSVDSSMWVKDSRENLTFRTEV